MKIRNLIATICRSLLVIALIVFAFNGLRDCASLSAPGTVSIATTPMSPTDGSAPIPAANAKWHKILVVTGNEMKKTQPFAVGAHWAIAWDSEPNDQGSGALCVSVYKAYDASAPVDIVANVMGKSNDQSYEYTPGTYYLDIDSDEPYAITILDYH